MSPLSETAEDAILQRAMRIASSAHGLQIRQAPIELCSGLEDDLRPAIVARIKMLIPLGRLGEWQSV